MTLDSDDIAFVEQLIRLVKGMVTATERWLLKKKEDVKA